MPIDADLPKLEGIADVYSNNIHNRPAYVQTISKEEMEKNSLTSRLKEMGVTFGKAIDDVLFGNAYGEEVKEDRDVSDGEYNPDGWPVPDIKNAKFLGEKKKDIISEIPGKETNLQGYKTPEGTYFNVLSINGKTYGFYVDIDGKPPMEFSLIDQQGAEKFTHKYDIGEKLPVPSYLLK